MSVKISDIMKFPSMQGAKILAGKSGVDRTVSSISVLEVGDPGIYEDEMLGNIRSFGSEIIITAFMFARYDVDMQCKTLYRLQLEGEIGIIIYYVGIVLPSIDKRVIDTADKLDFPLIIMPENTLELRYSDLICEVMEAIVRDRDQNKYFATEVIERLSHVEPSQRKVNVLLAILRDRTHCSIYLYDETDAVLNYAEWPHLRNLPMEELSKAYMVNNNNQDQEIKVLKLCNSVFYAFKSILICEKTNIGVVIISEHDRLSEETCKQILHVLKTYINLWSEDYGHLDTKQLVNAIINDEPVQLHLLSDKLKIEVESLSYAYFFFDKDNRNHEYSKLKDARNIVKDFVKEYDNSFLIDIYDETVVVFSDRKREKFDDDISMLLQEFKYNNLDYRGIVLDSVPTTRQVKEAYWKYIDNRQFISIVFPHKDIITGGELDFIRKAREEQMNSTNNDSFISSTSKGLLNDRIEAEYKNTLEVFLLDADRSITKTAELLYVHKNTVKYRLKILEEILGYKLTRMPEVYDLYIASAVDRLNNNSNE